MAIKKIHKIQIFPYGITTTVHCTSRAWVWLWKVCRFIMDYLNDHSNFEQRLQEYSILYHTKMFSNQIYRWSHYMVVQQNRKSKRTKEIKKKNLPKCVRLFFWLDSCFSLELYHFDCIHKWMSKWWKELKFAKVIGCHGDSCSAFKLDCVGLGLHVWFFLYFVFFLFCFLVSFCFFTCPKMFQARKECVDSNNYYTAGSVWCRSNPMRTKESANEFDSCRQWKKIIVFVFCCSDVEHQDFMATDADSILNAEKKYKQGNVKTAIIKLT